MVDSLKLALFDAVTRIVPEREVGIAFSGGVDSSLLAKICRDLGKKVKLITIGFSGSHDVIFSKSIASRMGMEHQVAEIGGSDFRKHLHLVREMVKCENASHIENCVAYLYVSKAAREANLDVVLSANGCDELFCGYNGYRLAYSAGASALMKLMDEKIASELELVDEIGQVARKFGVKIKQPFLDREFIAFAKSIPLDRKITGSGDMIRKHVLRAAALAIGVPEESAMKPKKALQYGSSIHRHFKEARASRA
ncbi:MAG: asparagine synthase C-terminal domain-containing protein [Nitrososphaera sp.]|nr:asparagine synthase C-terminal domain-containing protein [Nitrososphaera sp.]